MRHPLIRSLSLACAAALAASAVLADDAPPFDVTPVAKLSEPWALAFLPDARLLATEKKGALKVVTQDGKIGNITGVPRTFKFTMGVRW